MGNTMTNIRAHTLADALKIAALVTIIFVTPLVHANDWDKVDKAYDEAKEDTEKAADVAAEDIEKATDTALEDTDKAYEKAKVDTQEVIDENKPGTERFLDRVEVNSERVIDDIKEFGEKVSTEVKEEFESDSTKAKDSKNANQTQLVPVVIETQSLMIIRGVEDLASFKESLNTSFHYYSINGDSWSAPIILAKGSRLEVVETPAEDLQFAKTLADSLNATTDVVPVQTEVTPAQTDVVPPQVEVTPATDVAPAQTEVTQTEAAPKQFCAKTTSFKVDYSTDIISIHKFTECVVAEAP